MLTTMSFLHYWINWSLLWVNTSLPGSKPIYKETCRLSPLHRAAKSGDLASIQAVISQGQDIHEPCHQGYSALHHASQHGHVHCVEYLIDNGANLNAKACGGISPLHKAANAGCVDSVKLLLIAGADIDSKDCTGHTPLHTGARFGQIAVIAELVAQGAKQVPDQDGYTPLDEAIKYKQREAIYFLLNTSG